MNMKTFKNVRKRNEKEKLTLRKGENNPKRSSVFTIQPSTAVIKLYDSQYYCTPQTGSFSRLQPVLP